MVLSRTVGGVLAALAVLGACSDGGSDGGGSVRRPVVIATTSIWADVTGLVACDGSFEIRALVPPGGDAHGYEPSLRDREALDGAALVVANGAGLEELLDDTLADVEAGGVPVVRVAELTVVTGVTEVTDRDDSGAGDPHVWFDPTRVAAALPALGEAFVATGADAALIDECVSEGQETLAALDAEIEAILAPVPEARRLLVTNHDSLGPFADRYGFEILGTVVPSSSTLTEPNPGDLEALAEAIAAAGTPAIFTETLHAGTDAEALGRRLGIEVVELHTDSLGEPGSGAETYVGLMRTDAGAVAAALTG